MSHVIARILAKATVCRMMATSAFADEGVERPADGAAPTAFRIWKAGENPTSKGQTVFSRRSASLLIEDQNVRGSLYSIDVDHMSLSDEAPPEHHRAVGWHKLAVRETANGPELWAVDVQWTNEIKAALESDPPGFRYFSPAYDVERGTGEVVGYLNTALTNNPATYQVTALATRDGEQASRREEKDQPMKIEDVLAGLKAAAEGDDEMAKKAKVALAAFSDDEEKKDEPDGDEKKPAEDSEDEEKKDAEGDDDKDEKKDAIAAGLDAKSIEKLVDAKLAAIAENAERDRLLTSRGDTKLTDALKGEPLSVVKKVLAALPPTKRNPAADTSAQGTRGADHVDARSPRLSVEEKAKLDERMGIAPRRASIRRDGNHVVFGVLTHDDAKQVLATKKGGN